MRQFDLPSSYNRPSAIAMPLVAGWGNVSVVGRCYFNFGKNSAAVLHVAKLNSSSEQSFTWATVSEISFT
jgi:hypothetical protein